MCVRARMCVCLCVIAVWFPVAQGVGVVTIYYVCCALGNLANVYVVTVVASLPLFRSHVGVGKTSYCAAVVSCWSRGRKSKAGDITKVVQHLRDVHEKLVRVVLLLQGHFISPLPDVCLGNADFDDKRCSISVFMGRDDGRIDFVSLRTGSENLFKRYQFTLSLSVVPSFFSLFYLAILHINIF